MTSHEPAESPVTLSRSEPRRTLARREFLRWLGVGLAVPAVGLPARAAPGASTQDPQDPLRRAGGVQVADDLLAAVRRARGFGKPLLVAVIPFERGGPEGAGIPPQPAGVEPSDWPAWPPYSERGLRLGRALRYADDATLAVLATTELVCADRAELAQLLDVDGLPDAALLAVEPDGELHVAIDELPTIDLASDREPRQPDPRAEDKARAAARLFGSALRRALYGDAGRVARRLAVHRQRLGPAAIVFERPDQGTDDDLRRCAPLYYAAASAVADPAERARWIARLASLSRALWIDAGPVGARWAESSGCGSDYVDGRGAPLGIACGMGFVPPVNSLFLAFRVR
ncbi:MAG: hypothetical protein IPM29_30270 [Planctomycetes bacterium]|nr:hypothetical protein [Planctomycetota bacterium]